MSAEPPDQSSNLLLDLLPPEVLTLVLGQLDVLSIARFQVCSKSCRAVVAGCSQAIYETVAQQHYDMLTPCTATDSGISRSTISYDDDRSMTFIQKAIACQRTSSRIYEGTETWRELVKKRDLVGKTWRTGKPSRRHISIGVGQANMQLNVWRFKICPEKRMVLASTPTMAELGNGGVVLAVMMDAEGAYSPEAYCPFALASRGYTHIEYTNGYLVFVEPEGVNIWTWDPTDLPGNPVGPMRPLHTTLPLQITSYKARFPYLVAEQQAANKIVVMDIRTAQVVQEYTLTQDWGRSYVEIDHSSIFCANGTLLVIDRATGQITDLLSEDLYIKRQIEVSGFVSQIAGVRIYSQTWQAIHHSLDGKHMIAVGDGNELVWFRNYRHQLQHGTPKSRSDHVIVLRHNDGPESGLVPFDNVCVENGRVVFSVRTEHFPAVYMFELDGWTDSTPRWNESNVAECLPKIRLLSGGLPTGIDGISRIEMDSSSIYITSNSSPAFTFSTGIETPVPYNLNLSWYSLSEEYTIPANVVPVFAKTMETDDRVNMRDFLLEHRIFRNNSILVYDFADPVDQDLSGV